MGMQKRPFAPGPKDIQKFQEIANKRPDQREAILAETEKLARSSLPYALLALYRQQVSCGFVLGDPTKTGGKEKREFEDETTGVTFRLLWNPDRELRKNHDLLMQRGVIAESVDREKLVNVDGTSGKGCYLCEENIKLQNPNEILYPVFLDNERYLLGANFAYIDNNHFTVMSSIHRPQKCNQHVLRVLADFVSKTDGYFRAIFNGLAGASITEHEHFQVTTVPFPVEAVHIREHDVQRCEAGVRVSRPFYYTPLWVIEGNIEGNLDRLINVADGVISKWEKTCRKHHTENIIALIRGTDLRLFVFLRDTRRLAGPGKFGDMGSFECGGSIVLSHEPPPERFHETNERTTFERATLDTVRRLLADVAPVIPDVDLRALLNHP